MQNPAYLLACALPLLLTGARMLLLRGLPAAFSLAMDMLLLVISIPLGIMLIGHALHFPSNMGDHSPGIGVAFLPLLLVWIGCSLLWLGRFGWLATRKFAARRRG